MAMDFSSAHFDSSKIPIALNPNGDPPNFVDPPCLAHTISAVGIPLIISSSLCVLIRLATNSKHTGKLGLDDCKSIRLFSPFNNWLKII